MFKEFNIILSLTNKYSVKNLLKPRLSHRRTTEKKSGIYKTSCADCNKIYIGKTKRNLGTRKKEHFRNIKFKQIDKSAVAAHYWDENHEINQDIKLVKSVNTPSELGIWEKKFSKKVLR